MNIIELAESGGCKIIRPLAPHEFSIHNYEFTRLELLDFAQAIIEDYKASLEPVAYLVMFPSGVKDVVIANEKTNYEEHYMRRGDILMQPLFALPSGETK